MKGPKKIIEKKTSIEHPDCVRTITERKIVLSKKEKKEYLVTVRFVQLSEEETRIKKAIIRKVMLRSIIK